MLKVLKGNLWTFYTETGSNQRQLFIIKIEANYLYQNNQNMFKEKQLRP